MVARADRDRLAAADALAACARRLDAAVAAQRAASAVDPSTSVVVDSRRDGGRLVQLVGRAGAPVVVVLVPGVGTDPDDRDRLRGDAVRVWRALAAEVDDPDAVEVVSWLGYDPPDVVLGAIDPRPADEGAAALVRAVAELRRSGASRVTVVGHSYGAVVAGRAAGDGLAADVLVQVGAPGVGEPGLLARIEDRGMTYRVAREAVDPIALVPLVAGPLYGEDPVGRVPALPTSLSGHGAYLRDLVLLGALADLAVGRDQPVRSAPWESP
jgi:pimeloyl-ACP methyl ester carboxylesterase